MEIHGIFSSYFGDGEFDVGPAVKWNSRFFHTEYVLDWSSGHRTRSYIVDWAQSFPDVDCGYYQNEPTFFEPNGAARWRREAFEKADKSWSYAEDDWVCFVDCTEGMSCDDRVDRFPEDPADTNIFLPWLEAEIAVSGNGQISLPIYVLIGNSPAWMSYGVIDPGLQAIIDTMTDSDIYLSMTKYELNQINHYARQNSYQSWTLAGWSPRLFKVSTLRDLDFDWSSIDKFVITSPGDAATTGVSITSYAYARWAHDPTRIDYATMRPMTEADDDGWRIRQLMSRVRPVPGLGFDDWDGLDLPGRTYPHDDPPPAVVPITASFSRDFSDDFANFNYTVPTQPGADWVDWDYLQSLYPEIIRMNRREGLHFVEDEKGPVPWNFVSGQPWLSAEEQAARDARPTYETPLPPPPSSNQSPPPPVVPANAEPLHPNDTIHPEDTSGVFTPLGHEMHR